MLLLPLMPMEASLNNQVPRTSCRSVPLLARLPHLVTTTPSFRVENLSMIHALWFAIFAAQKMGVCFLADVRPIQQTIRATLVTIYAVRLVRFILSLSK